MRVRDGELHFCRFGRLEGDIDIECASGLTQMQVLDAGQVGSDALGPVKKSFVDMPAVGVLGPGFGPECVDFVPNGESVKSQCSAGAHQTWHRRGRRTCGSLAGAGCMSARGQAGEQWWARRADIHVGFLEQGIGVNFEADLGRQSLKREAIVLDCDRVRERTSKRQGQIALPSTVDFKLVGSSLSSSACIASAADTSPLSGGFSVEVGTATLMSRQRDSYLS